MQAKRWLKNRLGVRTRDQQGEQEKPLLPISQTPQHGGSFRTGRKIRKARSLRRGFLLVESLVSLSVITAVGLILMKLSLNVLHPRQWTLQQAVADAYMTYERSYAERISFDTLVSNVSPWPTYPAVSNVANVEIGRLPGGRAISGTVTRTLFVDTDASTATNPSRMVVCRAQSVLRYTVGGRTYLKSRTVLRSQ